MFKMPCFKVGIRYVHGKVLIYKGVRGNPSVTLNEQPSWAVDIREIIAMVFAGTLALAFVMVGEYGRAETIGVGLVMYATGRTVPGGGSAKH